MSPGARTFAVANGKQEADTQAEGRRHRERSGEALLALYIDVKPKTGHFRLIAGHSDCPC